MKIRWRFWYYGREKPYKKCKRCLEYKPNEGKYGRCDFCGEFLWRCKHFHKNDEMECKDNK